nr:PepSY-associated TM helix domain-containing protein [Ameyamaea chiangmaiensis]
MHAWLGFLGGVVLFAIFLSGSLAVFDAEITRWMQPDAPVASSLDPSPEALRAVAAQLDREWKRYPSAFLTLPGRRAPGLHILHYDGHVFSGPVFDVRDGHSVPLRRTDGGRLFFDLHFTLRGGTVPGVVLVDLAALVMLVGVVSGMALHCRALWADMLTFRPGAARVRAWLDMHLLTGVLFLPFVAMITYTGIALDPEPVFPVAGRVEAETPAPRPAVTPEPLDVVLPRVVRDAASTFGPDGAGFVLFAPQIISVYRADGRQLAMTRDRLDFARDDGHRLAAAGGHDEARGVISGLHMAQWASWPVRWLYFLSGLAGTALIGTGLVIFLMKRRDRFHALRVYRVGEGMTLATVIGLPLACSGYLYANRLLPPRLANRAALETDLFLMLWLGWTIVACVGALRQVARPLWRAGLVGLGGALVTLPLLDVCTRPVAGAVPTGVVAGVDGCALVVGVAALLTARRIGRAV